LESFAPTAQDDDVMKQDLRAITPQITIAHLRSLQDVWEFLHQVLQGIAWSVICFLVTKKTKTEKYGTQICNRYDSVLKDFI
jgi:hypothetical protein